VVSGGRYAAQTDRSARTMTTMTRAPRRLAPWLPLTSGDVALGLGVAMGVFAIFAFGITDYRASIQSSSDFSGFWAGPRAIVLGIDPYDPATWIRTAADLGTKLPDTDVYAYPPWVAFALLPFGLLPLSIATDAWTGLGLVVAIVALRALLQATVPEIPLVHWLAGVALLMSQPGIATYFNGQWTYFLLAASIGVFLLHAARPAIAGFLALSALLKPQLFVFALWSWLRAAAARGRLPAFVLTSLGGMAVIVAAAAILTPRWLEAWFTRALTIRVTDPTTPTLTAAFADIVGGLGPVAAAVTLLVAVALALRFDPAGMPWWSVWTVLSLLGATYTRSYDQLLLLPPLIVSTAVVAERSRGRAVAYAALWGTVLLPGSLALQGLAAYRERENFTIALTAVIFIMIVLVHRSGRRGPDAASCGGSPRSVAIT
jgi:hypothetical protein